MSEPEYKPITGMINVNDIQEIIENNRYYQQEIERLKEALLDINDVLNSDADVNSFCGWQVNEIADIVEKVDE